MNYLKKCTFLLLFAVLTLQAPLQAFWGDWFNIKNYSLVKSVTGLISKNITQKQPETISHAAKSWSGGCKHVQDLVEKIEEHNRSYTPNSKLNPIIPPIIEKQPESIASVQDNLLEKVAIEQNQVIQPESKIEADKNPAQFNIESFVREDYWPEESVEQGDSEVQDNLENEFELMQIHNENLEDDFQFLNTSQMERDNAYQLISKKIANVLNEANKQLFLKDLNSYLTKQPDVEKIKRLANILNFDYAISGGNQNQWRTLLYIMGLSKNIEAKQKQFGGCQWFAEASLPDKNSSENSFFAARKSLKLKDMIEGKQELREDMVKQYKMHLMPKKENMFDSMFTLLYALKRTPKLPKLINRFKCQINLDESLDDKSYDPNKEVFPRIIIYAADGQDNAQKLLTKLMEIFKGEKGLGIPPRFNAIVGEDGKIFYGHGDGDVKIDTKGKEHFAPWLVHYKADFTGTVRDYSLKW